MPKPNDTTSLDALPLFLLRDYANMHPTYRQRLINRAKTLPREPQRRALLRLVD